MGLLFKGVQGEFLQKPCLQGENKMEEMEKKEEILQAVREAAEARGGKLPCAVAQELAWKLGVPMRAIGQAADELKIKIVQCQLGCF